MTATQTQKVPFSAHSALATRIAWAHAQEAKELWPGGPTPLQYVEGLPRATGSYVEHVLDINGLTDLLSACDDIGWTDVTNDLDAGITKPGHEYYQVSVPGGYSAFAAVAQVKDLDGPDLDLVRVVKGAHGHELQYPGEPRPTHVITAIVDKDGLVTWFPGNPTPALDLHNATVKFTR